MMKSFYEFTDYKNNTYTVSLVDAESYPLDGIKDPDLRTFFQSYQASIRDHRENVEVICDRLKYQLNPPTYLAICRCKSQNVVIGGYILEYYANSKFCLLPYIFIDDSHRKKQIGTNLGKSLQFLVKSILVEQMGKPVKTILFELAAHPEYIDIVRYAPVAQFFSKIEGVWIDIPYIEPISGSTTYLVGAIPVAANLRENITRKDLYQFFDELYSLSNQSILNSQFFLDNFLPWREEVGGKRKKITDKIKEFPKLVQPKIQFSKVSVALHFVQQSGITLNWEALKNRKHVYDTVFNSFEKDLFSQRFVDDPPYYSKHVDVQDASVKFNNILSFNSEGREETFILLDENGKMRASSVLEKKVKVYLNHTVFRKKDLGTGLNDNVVIWEVVLSPVDPFNEYELIQLEKYFTGKQEEFTIDIQYCFDKWVFGDLFDFVEKLIGNGGELRREVLAGTIQIDTSGLKYIGEKKNLENTSQLKRGWDWPQVYQYYNSELGGKKNIGGADKLELIYDQNEDARYCLNVFCGIALGIFDFDRMSIEEVNDTLVPLSKTDSYFLILNKSSIACFCHDNDIYSNALKYGIGINPYVIIPNAVLAYNSYLTMAVNDQTLNIDKRRKNALLPNKATNEHWIQKVKGKLLGKTLSDGLDGLADLIEQKNEIGSFLKNLIPNVFQYETERELYSYGMEKRGIVDKREDLEESKKELEERISHLVNERANLLGKLSLILGIISLSQIYQFFDAIKSLFTSNDPSLSKYVSLFFTILLLGVFAHFSLKNYKIVVVDKKKPHAL